MQAGAIAPKWGWDTDVISGLGKSFVFLALAIPKVKTSTVIIFTLK